MIISLSHIRRFKPDGYLKNIASMFAGNVSGNMIALLTAPIVTRLYTPEDFGVMTLIWAIIGIFSIVACLRYDIAIVISKDEKEADQLFVLCCLIAFLISIFLTGILCINALFSNILPIDKSLLPFLWLVPLGVFVSGMFQSVSSAAVRMKSFGRISWGRILASVNTGGVKILAGIAGAATPFWLITGNIAGPFSAMLFLMIPLYSVRFREKKHKFTVSSVMDVAKKYIDFPKYRAATGLLNSLTQNLPVLLFGVLFSDMVVGFYGLTNAVLRRPVMLVSQSLSKVFLQKASELQDDNKKLSQIMLKTMGGLAGIGLLPACMLFFFGEWIFITTFGENWALAGKYACVLAPWFLMLLINVPATQILLIKRKLRFNFYFNIIYICLRVLAIVVGYILSTDAFIAICMFSVSGVLGNLFLIWYAFRTVQHEEIKTVV